MIFFDKLMEGERIPHLINSFRLASKDLIVEIHFARSAFTFCFSSTWVSMIFIVHSKNIGEAWY